MCEYVRGWGGGGGGWWGWWTCVLKHVLGGGGGVEVFIEHVQGGGGLCVWRCLLSISWGGRVGFSEVVLGGPPGGV